MDQTPGIPTTSAIPFTIRQLDLRKYGSTFDPLAGCTVVAEANAFNCEPGELIDFQFNQD